MNFNVRRRARSARGAASVMTVACALAASGSASAVTVPGSANPYLAGMNAGATAYGGDHAPNQSAVMLTNNLIAGTALRFAVSGGVNAGGATTYDRPDGTPNIHHYGGAENGISDIQMPINALVGIFLTDASPEASAAPGRLDFTPLFLGTSFQTLAPGLKQVFFIGDGLTAEGIRQQFVVPQGATRLYLATTDEWGWYNNSGAFEVALMPVGVPMPPAAGMGLLGLGVAACWAGVRRLFADGRPSAN